MYRLNDDKPFMLRLIDKQFEMIGQTITFREVENGVEVKEGKKQKVYPWYEIFFFDNEEQYQKWRDWATEEVRKKYNIEGRELNDEVNFLDLLYGMKYVIKKEGELF